VVVVFLVLFLLLFLPFLFKPFPQYPHVSGHSFSIKSFQILSSQRCLFCGHSLTPFGPIPSRQTLKKEFLSSLFFPKNHFYPLPLTSLDIFNLIYSSHLLQVLGHCSVINLYQIVSLHRCLFAGQSEGFPGADKSLHFE